MLCDKTLLLVSGGSEITPSGSYLLLQGSCRAFSGLSLAPACCCCRLLSPLNCSRFLMSPAVACCRLGLGLSPAGSTEGLWGSLRSLRLLLSGCWLPGTGRECGSARSRSAFPSLLPDALRSLSIRDWSLLDRDQRGKIFQVAFSLSIRLRNHFCLCGLALLMVVYQPCCDCSPGLPVAPELRLLCIVRKNHQLLQGLVVDQVFRHYGCR